MGEGSISIRVEKVFALLIESGFVYCCLWVGIKAAERIYTCRRGLTTLTQILYLVSAFRVFPEPGFTVMDSVLLFASVSPVGESTGGSALETEALTCALGLVSDAHRDPCLRSEEPC